MRAFTDARDRRHIHILPLQRVDPLEIQGGHSHSPPVEFDLGCSVVTLPEQGVAAVVAHQLEELSQREDVTLLNGHPPQSSKISALRAR